MHFDAFEGKTLTYVHMQIFIQHFFSGETRMSSTNCKTYILYSRLPKRCSNKNSLLRSEQEQKKNNQITNTITL